MALNVISNYAANVAQRNLRASDAAASNSIAKLSSGSRVNSARDDAASLAIGSRLRAEVAALKTASVNTAQAGSLLQIADGALATVADILVRMKELAVQASSGQFSSIERGVLDSEFQALSEEITRISQDTEFNGTQLIAGGATTVANAVDSNTGFVLGSGDGFTSFSFDSSVADGAFQITYDAATNVLTATNLVTNAVEAQAIDPAAIIAQAAGQSTNVQFNTLGLTVALNNNFTDANLTTVASAVSASGGTLDFAAGAITINSLDLRSVTGASDIGNGTDVTLAIDTGTNGTDSILTIAAAGNDFVATGVNLSGAGTVTVTLTRDALDSNGATVVDSITIDFVVGTGADGNDLENETVTLGNLRNVVFAAQTGDATQTSFSFKVGSGSETWDSLAFSVSAASASSLGVLGTTQGGSIGITTAALADTASAAVSDAINTLNQTRSDIGAAQNRLTFAAANLASAIENAEAARSGLLDLDVASEITTFTSKQILVQTGVSTLAQANQLPQNLLRLFQ